MVYRVFVRKKEGFNQKEKSLKSDFKTFLKIKNLSEVRIYNRYDIDKINEEDFKRVIDLILMEKQVDDSYLTLPEFEGKHTILGVSFLPGQFDQRASSCEECIQILTQKERPIVKSAIFYDLIGDISKDDLQKIKKYLINPVDSYEVDNSLPISLNMVYPEVKMVKTIEEFRNFSKEELQNFLKTNGLAMDENDLKFTQDYFKQEKRDPTITEIKVIDTYWSDHCRHTTFLTNLENIKFEDEEVEKSFKRYLECRKYLNREKPITLMDIATIGMKVLKKQGKLENLDESEEINACSVKIDVPINGENQKWLLLFKNETHNHPTEIEPFGGAATCIGGAIRDPLSGRGYVYQAMRITGAADPTLKIENTLKGKLPQKKICLDSCNGYSSYGNQIGLATSYVKEIYHKDYVAKRMEVGAVLAATPLENVVRERPVKDDVVILLGGKTGRDGCGGATGSSKEHNLSSLDTCSAEVQKGNPIEERKLQRLFRNKQATLLIKRCNDFGAGGVSVAIGELADSLEINLDLIKKKYEGLDGTELAISESQERMAVVVSKENASKFLNLAEKENIEATIVAKVTDSKRLIMKYKNTEIVNLKREFLASNGAKKYQDVIVSKSDKINRNISKTFKENLLNLLKDLNVCSSQGLVNRFDSTIGSNTLLMPFGGKYQLTPSIGLASKIAVEKYDTDLASLMAYGFNPYLLEKDCYKGAYLAVIESVSKLLAMGGKFKDIYLSFQEYFLRLHNNPYNWGLPFKALLGGLDAQLDLGIAAIGGKDSMSGSFEKINVPPTLISFAVTTSKCEHVVSNEFKKSDSKILGFIPHYKNELPEINSLKACYAAIENLTQNDKILSLSTPSYGGMIEMLFKSCIGNKIGLKINDKLDLDMLFNYRYGSFILEVNNDFTYEKNSEFDVVDLGTTTLDKCISYQNQEFNLDELIDIYESKLEEVYPINFKDLNKELIKTKVDKITYLNKLDLHSPLKIIKPKVLIPVFPGTNCEYDSEKKVLEASLDPVIYVINNLDKEHIVKSIEEFAFLIKNSQIIFIPGGFSGGDEPDGSAKFITSFFRNKLISDALDEFLNKRGGLMLGICNGFQALIKLGLLPYGKIIEPTKNSPTLTFNTISRHQSMIVNTRICSTKSVWMKKMEVNQTIKVAISHGEGRFIANNETLKEMIDNGQIITQYVDLDNNPTMDIHFNPNSSYLAIEGITSKDGKILGKMGHFERSGKYLYKNVEGDYTLKLFEAAKEYFN